MKTAALCLKSLWILFLIHISGCSFEATPEAPVWNSVATLKTIKAGAGTKLTQLNGGIEISSQFSRLPKSSGVTGGAYFTVPSSIEKVLSGKRIKVSLLALTPEQDGTIALALAYSTNRTGNSGWRRADTELGIRQYAFYYDVPDDEMKGTRKDYIGILSDLYGVISPT